MLLADCCFNITHESLSYDLDEIMQRAEEHKVQYFFAPASKESEILKLLNFCENYDQNSFDPNYISFPLDFFKPMVIKIFSRKPYSVI